MHLGRLASLTENPLEQNVCVLRDFNATPGTNIFSDIKHMHDDCDLKLADVKTLPLTSFTHVNQGCLSCIWLDNVVLSPYLYSVIDECTVLYNNVASGNCSSLVSLKLNGPPALTQVKQANGSKVKWEFYDIRKREEYGQVVTELLRDTATDHVRIYFQNTCLDSKHHNATDRLHWVMKECMMHAGETVLGTCSRRWRQIPGWNESVRETHSAAKESFLEWRTRGGPCCGPLVEEIKYQGHIQALSQEVQGS